MVEGHSVHRLASRFRAKLVGRAFAASSPNGRFADGAAAIDGRVLSRMEAVGKNLFAFFRDGAAGGGADVVVHVHFGMSGAWSLFGSPDEEPATAGTTRLRLAELAVGGGPAAGCVAHLSAMTVAHGPPSLFSAKKASLGEDPLRPDADPDRLYRKVAESKRAIGQLLMDQSFFAGPGNIYRAEILFLAGVYPTTMGRSLDRAAFDRVWAASVSLLRRGYDAGSILTVDPKVDPALVARGERGYIYNRSACARCGCRVGSWNMSGRTCYACEGGVCQPQRVAHSRAGDELVGEATGKTKSNGALASKTKKKEKAAEKPQQHTPFISHCAPTNLRDRLAQGGAVQLTVAEIRAVMEQMSSEGKAALPPKSAKKAVQVAALDALVRRPQSHVNAEAREEKAPTPENSAPGEVLPPPAVSAEDAAREKAASGEHRAVEHVAELSRGQAVRAISVTPSPAGTKARTHAASPSSSPAVPPEQARHLAQVVVGTKIEVYWPDDGVFYSGYIHSHHPNREATGKHPGHEYTIHYDDGEVERLDLSVERFMIIGRKARGDAERMGKRGNIMVVKEEHGSIRKKSRRRLLLGV